MRINRILTDLGNVVVVANHAVTIAKVVNEGVPYERAKNFFTIPEYKEFARGSIGAHLFFHAVSSAMWKGWSMDWVRDVHNAHMYAIDREVLAILEEASKSVPFAIATDTNVWQTARVEEELLKGTFLADCPHIFRSNEIRKLKADDGTFNYYALMLQENPENILFIDDRRDLCERARAAGFQALWYRSDINFAGHLKVFLKE